MEIMDSDQLKHLDIDRLHLNAATRARGKNNRVSGATLSRRLDSLGSFAKTLIKLRSSKCGSIRTFASALTPVDTSETYEISKSARGGIIPIDLPSHAVTGHSSQLLH